VQGYSWKGAQAEDQTTGLQDLLPSLTPNGVACKTDGGIGKTGFQSQIWVEKGVAPAKKEDRA
jgi:hypothetical protein